MDTIQENPKANASSSAKRNRPENVCFVIGPIGRDGTVIRKNADMLFHAVISPALSSTYHCLRADMEKKPGLITDAIIQRINESALVVADFTTLNANVFYELGIRHAAAKATIHMAEVGTELPFDNVGSRAIFYDLTDWHRMQQTVSELAAQARETEAAGYKPSNPVTQALTISAFRASPDKEEKAIAQMAQRIESLEKNIAKTKTSEAPFNPQLKRSSLNGAHLVESIEKETANIAERRENMMQALDSLVKNSLINSTKKATDAFAESYAKSRGGFAFFASKVNENDYASIEEAVDKFEDIPF